MIKGINPWLAVAIRLLPSAFKAIGVSWNSIVVANVQVISVIVENYDRSNCCHIPV